MRMIVFRTDHRSHVFARRDNRNFLVSPFIIIITLLLNPVIRIEKRKREKREILSRETTIYNETLYI